VERPSADIRIYKARPFDHLIMPAAFSTIRIVGTLVSVRIICGVIDASAPNPFAVPITLSPGSTTLSGSGARLILQVPTGWDVVATFSQTYFRSQHLSHSRQNPPSPPPIALIREPIEIGFRVVFTRIDDPNRPRRNQ